MMKDDNKFYAAGGIFFVLVGIGIVLWLIGFPAIVPVLILGGIGIVLIAFSNMEAITFFTGVTLLSIGSLLTAVMYSLSAVIAFAIFIVIIGICMLLYLIMRR